MSHTSGWIAAFEAHRGPYRFDDRVLPAMLAQGTLMLEFTLVRGENGPLPLIHLENRAAGWREFLSLGLDAQGRIALTQRRGDLVHAISLDAKQEIMTGGRMRLSWRWDGPGRESLLTLKALDHGTLRQHSGRAPLPLTRTEALALVAGDGRAKIGPRVSCLELADVAAKLDDTISAVLISHMRGHTSDMDAILALAEARGVPVIEDAAHSLGTLWHGRKIGTLGRVGCFSFQSYKLVNSGEGGILVTDDPEIAARAIIMSGAYEHNWKKHPGMQNSFHHWQNKLPLYNMRMNNLSAVLVRAQLPEVARRVRDGRANHDHVAGLLNASPWLSVPPALAPEERAPDSIQFNLEGFESDDEARAFQAAAKARGVSVQVFGLSEDNARAFWNWEFLGAAPELPQTRAMLMRACDVRLPARLARADLDFIAGALIAAADAVKGEARAYGT